MRSPCGKRGSVGFGRVVQGSLLTAVGGGDARGDEPSRSIPWPRGARLSPGAGAGRGGRETEEDVGRRRRVGDAAGTEPRQSRGRGSAVPSRSVR